MCIKNGIVESIKIKDHIETVKFAIECAMVETCDLTGLHYGSKADQVRDKIYEKITDRKFRWAFKKLFCD